VPAFLADSKYRANGKKFLNIPSWETVYSIWIGTNDLGNYAFITDSQVKGKTIPDYINCVYSVLDQVYKNGGRYFVLQNLAPLQLAPLYATPENGGVGANHYWPEKPDNLTLISYRMWEQVANVNDVFKYQTPYELLVARRYPGARFAVMDMYGLVCRLGLGKKDDTDFAALGALLQSHKVFQRECTGECDRVRKSLQP
jgi:hypothetical protein